MFIDAVHFSIRDDGVIRKLAAYVVLGINEDGKKEVLTITVGENESSKYWLSVLPSSQALLKALYLATFEIVKKWTVPIRNRGKIRGELAVMYPDRMPE